MLFPSYWSEAGRDNWFVIGLNYPGIPHSGRGGYHLGPNQIMNHDDNQVTSRTLDALQQDFRRIRNMGGHVVRMWAFTQGQGIRWTISGDNWIVQGLDPSFRENVIEITRRAELESVKIYWTLFNGGDFIDDTTRALSRRMKRAFLAILEDEPSGSRRRPVTDTLLPDFMSAIELHRDGVFAVDLMNEPDCLWPDSIVADMRELYSLSTSQIWLLRARLFFDSSANDPQLYMSFLRECASAVHGDDPSSPRMPVSVGCCRFNSVRMLIRELDSDLDFYDYHHYNHLDVSDAGLLPLPRWDMIHSTKPCLIGEFGLCGEFQKEYMGMSFTDAFRRGRPSSQPRPRLPLELLQPLLPVRVAHRPLPVALEELFDAQANCVNNVMFGAYERGYGGCLVWEYGKQYTNQENDYSPYVPRRLDAAAGWGDRHFITWTPDPSIHVPACFDYRFDPSDGRLLGRPAVPEIVAIAEEHRAAGRCPPL